MPRQGRIDYQGALNHIIGRGIERKAIFKEEADKSAFLKRIKENLAKSSMRCYAWCVMDNHFHLLLETGKTGMAEFMRRLLTGYAVYYNTKHKRNGHLFQNRYKSILCDKDEYLLLIIRYIHLNPVKADVIGIERLNKYQWTGHKELMGNEDEGIIECQEVLGYFGKRQQQALKEYEGFIIKGVGEREDYEGGGLIRSAGGLDEAIKRRPEEREMYDERILGDGDFVEQVHAQLEAEEQIKVKDSEELLNKISRFYGQRKEDIVARPTKEVRAPRVTYLYLGNKYLSKSLTQLGRQLGIKQPAASMGLAKGKEEIRRIGGEEKILL
ncbi:MAG: transposase [Candidatus Omnitrophica bacterium]|nr:transposase [Candidatus Omnitrophota bacterium]